MFLSEKEIKALVDLGIRLENLSEDRQYLVIKKSLIEKILKENNETIRNTFIDLLKGLEEDYNPKSN